MANQRVLVLVLRAATHFRKDGMDNMKAGLVIVVIAGAAALGLWMQYRGQQQIREENAALRQQIQLLATDNERLSNQVAQTSATPADTAPEQERELLRLRSEVGKLRRQAAEAAKTPAAAPAVAIPPSSPQPIVSPDEEARQVGIAKLNFTKGWLMAFMTYAQKNGDQLPTTFEQAAPFMSEEIKATTLQNAAEKYGLGTEQFEIVYQGAITSLPSPQNIIVMRERQGWQQRDGSWSRTYGFADGHSEIHRAADGNFAPWEAQHLAGAQGGVPGQLGDWAGGSTVANTHCGHGPGSTSPVPVRPED